LIFITSETIEQSSVRE